MIKQELTEGRGNTMSNSNVKSKFTRIIWVDYAGILRTKVVPDDYLTSNPKLTLCGMTLTVQGGYPPNGTQGPAGEVSLLAPMLRVSVVRSVRRIPVAWHPNHTFEFADMYDHTGKPWIHGPHETLRRAVRLLEEQGLQMQAGYELEFALLKFNEHTGEWKSWPNVGTMVYASAEMYDMAAGILDEIYETLLQMDIKVRMLHAENGNGQFEVVLQHSEVIRAVENMVLAREAIRTIARAYNLKATFAPKWGSVVGNGGHVHVSLVDHFRSSDKQDEILKQGLKLENGQHDNGSYRHASLSLEGIDEIGQSFTAGIVDGLQWLMFPLNSSPLSYERTVPGRWAGAYQCWGINNKETPVRLVEDRSNVEIKVGDCVSNPFIGMAGIIVAGLIGLKKKLSLTEPIQGIPGDVPKLKRLPKNLIEGMTLFQKKSTEGDKEFNAVFPAPVVQDLVAVREVEVLLDPFKLKDMMVRLF